jgi:hypothetical protein
MSARRRGSKRTSGDAGKPARRTPSPPPPPHEGTLPAESFELPVEPPCDVRDEPAPSRRGRVIHERRPAPRVPDEDEPEARRPG